jgi:dienelactone hydrolase
VLLLYGADDQRVPPKTSAAAIQAALKEGGNDKVTLRVFPGADHTFALTKGTEGHAWPRHVALYAETVVDWALRQSNANTPSASRQ